MALQYSVVELSIKWTTDLNTYVSTAPGQIECWCKYVYLDDQERKAMVSGPQRYLIEQVQHNGCRAVDATDGKSHLVDLEFRHPVKELIWCHPSGTGDAVGADLWNMTAGDIDAAVGMPIVGGHPGLTRVVPHQAGGVVLASNTWSEDANGPCAEASIQLNGQDVAINQGGTVFNQTQPYYHHSGCPVPGIYSYSFALNPEAYQPSGTCNFSRIDNGTLRFRLLDGIEGTDTQSFVSMFATNYNIMNISAGMCSMAFTN